MATTISTLAAMARTQASTTDAASFSVTDVVHDAVESVRGDKVGIDIDIADQRIAAPHAIAARALAPVLGNAVRFAATRVNTTSSADGAGPIGVIIEDDGPGVTNDAGIFAPGTTSHGGTGARLGLTLARQMAHSVGGDIDLTSERTPTRFEIRQPRA